ncbi:MAG: Methyl-accepting chemotaxis protein 4 [Candidatus Heimdallarchaeota archaeon LC_2]|nr:MAG: Methyl-accepting chemotaxis protein 4 [Candidatus Heimdallarchaeota archaeon LC_2]
MADSSDGKSSSKGFFLNRSILWKVFFVFIVVLALLVFQFAVIFSSITSISNETNDAFSQIKTKNEENRLLVDISDTSVLLNAQLEYIKSLYTGYLFDTITDAPGIYNNLTRSIESVQAKTFFIDSKLVTLRDKYSPELEAVNMLPLFLLVDRNLDLFDDSIDLIFNSVPTHLSSSSIDAFNDFSNIIHYKVSTLLQWMYSNNNATLLESVQEQNTTSSTYMLTVNQTLLGINEIDSSVYDQVSPFLSTMNQAYSDLFAQFNLIITEVEGKSFDHDLYDQTIINNAIDEIGIITENMNSNSILATSVLISERIAVNTQVVHLNTIFTEILSDLDNLISWSSEKQKGIEADLTTIRDDSSNQIKNLIDTITIVLLVSFLFSIGFVLALLVISNFQISRPIKHISFWSEKISNQDLSYSDYKSNRTDEIGVLHNNFRIMNKNLKDIIIEVKGSSAIVSETANELLSNTEEINATAEEVSAIAQSMAKGSTQQAELIATIVEELQVTSETVDSVISQINYNLRIIHELSEQTNILALNTAIEAANAGEFGRGFAVISENIRKMASQSKKTTEEVTKDSRDVLFQLQTTFSNITGKIENVAAVSQETAASAEEVAASAQELTAVMETVSAKSSILNERSSQSEELVKNFILERASDPNQSFEKKSNGERPAKEV